VELPPNMRHVVRPILDLVLRDALVRAAAPKLFAMMTDGTSGNPTPKLACNPQTVYAAGCLACEIEDSLQDLPGDAASIRQPLESMRCLQWVSHCHLQWLEQSSGRLSLPTPCKPAAVAAAATQPAGATSLPKRRRDAAKAAPDCLAPCSSTGAPKTKTGANTPQNLMSEGPSDSGSDWEESEDINTDSSEEEGGPDNGSDLEGFVDLSDEANPYGIAARFDPDADLSTVSSETIKAFMSTELVEDYQDHCDDMFATLPPCPSSPAGSQEAMSPLGSSSAWDQSAKRRRLSQP